MATLWRGYLRLSLVSCPVTLAPATSEASRIRLNQLSKTTHHRLRQKMVDEQTGEEVERADIVKGYQIEKGQYVLLDDDELAAIQIESSKTIDLETFVDADEIDCLYFDKPYYMAPDGEVAAETYHVITRAMQDKGKVGLGRVALSTREHPVAVEPHRGGLLMTTLRAANEVRQPEMSAHDDAEVNDEAVALASMIIDKRSGRFNPGAFHDRYQDALRELVEAKAKGRKITLPPIAAPGKVIDLMDALKRSLAESPGAVPAKSAAKKKKAADPRQRHLLLPVSGSKEPAHPARRKSAGKARKRA
ncbi:MAG TPA: Ku protein [Stellaceae bacterium]|nr:Ku protein [Stellaceae bacterium]